MQGFFEKNAVGDLKRRIWVASDSEIERILGDYGVPSSGEMEKSGCYIQNTVRVDQERKRAKNDLVLIPLGSTELHGPHCSSNQDTIQASRMCEAVRRYTSKQGNEVNIAYSPWMYGNHPKHHVGMLGTVPVSPSVLQHLLVDVMFGLWADGYRKFIFVNNHAQHWVITSAIDAFALRYPELSFYAVAFDWCSAVWEFFQTRAAGGLSFEDDFIHADEAETSLMLLLAPEMVNMKYAVDTKVKGYLPEGHFNKSANQCAFRPNLWWSVRNNAPLEFVATPEGVVGRATLASAEKAKRPVAAALSYLTHLHNDILTRFPAGTLPPLEEVTLFRQEEVEGYHKKPGEKGYRNPYQLWRPF